MQGKPASAFNLTQQQSILHEIGAAWSDLESEINTSAQDVVNDQINIAAGSDDSNVEQPIMCTYETLREQYSLLYSGSNLCSIVTRFQKVGANPACILQQV